MNKQEVRKQANLKLLQRTCSADIIDIVSTASHVVLYEWETSAWKKCDMEGSLFLAVQDTNEYDLIILNRSSVDNFQMSVTSSLQLQHQEPYLILKTNEGGTMKIRGIWFHNADERVAMNYILHQTVKDLKSGTIQPIPKVAKQQPPQQPPTRASSAPHTQPQQSQQPMDVNAATATLTALLGVTDINKDETACTNCPPPNAPPPRASSNPTATAHHVSSNQNHNKTPSPAASTGSNHEGVALDKKSLQLALLSLIQDDRFLDLLHSQYLRVVRSRVKKQQQNQDDSR